MWRLAILCTVLLLGLCSCLTALTQGDAAAQSAEPRYWSYDTNVGELPTPQLFGVDLDVSTP